MPTGPNDDTHVTDSNITIGYTYVTDSNTHGAMPTGPGGDTHVADSHTAASPTFGDNDTHVVNSDTAMSPTLKRKRKYSPAQIAQRQRRRYDRRSLSAANLAPDGGSTQAGGSGGSRVRTY